MGTGVDAETGVPETMGALGTLEDEAGCETIASGWLSTAEWVAAVAVRGREDVEVTVAAEAGVGASATDEAAGGG